MSSHSDPSWRSQLPAKIQAAAGIAAEVEQTKLLKQQQSLQLPQPYLLVDETTEHSRRSSQQTEVTGAFARLPVVPVSTEIIESALKRAGKVGPNKKIKNEAQKARSRAAQQMDTLTKEIAVPLGQYIKGFPPLQRLHPFEQAMLELTCGRNPYERALAKLDSLRKSILETGKGYAGRANKATTKAEAVAICAEGFASLEKLYLKSGRCVDDLKQLAQKLRRLPVVDPTLPVVALVGAPNVGKSSLVNVLSSGVPEVCDYPFTTRSVKMGHFFINGQRHQVTDTPGLLNRPLEERNAMERLTLACLTHLPSSILFVLDLTAQCGTSVQDQLAIRQELKQSFPDKLWLDVISKSDLLTAHLKAADSIMHQAPDSSHAQASTSSSTDWEFKARAQQASRSGSDRPSESHQGPQLAQQTDSSSLSHEIDADAAASNGNDSSVQDLDDIQHQASEVAGSAAAADLSEEQEEWGPVMDADKSMTDAVQAACLLPAALRISSVTEDGIENLQHSVMRMLRSQNRVQ